MKPDYHRLTLANLNNGAASDLFEYALKKALANILDENTPIKAKRKIKLEVTLTPLGQRDNIATSVSVSSDLADIKPHQHYVILSNRDGEVAAYTTDPRQQDLEFTDKDDNVTQFPGGTQ